jgi:hypothetical protein
MVEMSEGSDRRVSQEASKAAGTVVAGRRPPAVMLQGLGRPIVLNIKNKKKRRYTSSLKDRQVAMRDSAKAGERLFEALAAGFGDYRKKANKSAKKKKDGELKDFSRNMASGLSKTIKKLGKMPRVFRKSSMPSSNPPQMQVFRFLGSPPVQFAMSTALPRLLPPQLLSAARLVSGR